MKRAIYYRGCIINKYYEREPEYLIITPARVPIIREDAVNFIAAISLITQAFCTKFLDNKLALLA